MSDDRCCGNCRYHMFDDDQDDWECRNCDSDSFMSWTGYHDGCEDYEPREPKSLSKMVSSEVDRRDWAFRNYGNSRYT